MVVPVTKRFGVNEGQPFFARQLTLKSLDGAFQICVALR
jgi:hypothetical protein